MHDFVGAEHSSTIALWPGFADSPLTFYSTQGGITTLGGDRVVRTTTLEYLQGTTEKIPGWMNPYAGRITAELLAKQAEMSLPGSLMEIGVYGGKYLSVMYDDARTTRSLIVAIDPYEHFTPEQIATALGTRASDDLLRFFKAYSTDINSQELGKLLGDRCRFASIDGSHDAGDVQWDIQIVYDNLHPQGIVAIDDFLNTECLGVVEAVGRFLDRKPNLAPFLFTSNKLFLCPVRAVDTYKDALISFARRAPEIGNNEDFIKAHDANPLWSSSEFYGHRLLVMS